STHSRAIISPFPSILICYAPCDKASAKGFVLYQSFMGNCQDWPVGTPVFLSVFLRLYFSASSSELGFCAGAGFCSGAGVTPVISAMRPVLRLNFSVIFRSFSGLGLRCGET